jgi:hypothetical protein
MPARHFSPPWTVDEGTESCIIRDHNGQALAYVNYDGEKGWRGINQGLTRYAHRAQYRQAAGAAEAAAVLTPSSGGWRPRSSAATVPAWPTE